MLTCEALIYEQVFFIVSHRVSEVHGFATPPPALKFVDYPPTVILFVDGIVGAESGCVKIIYHGLVAVPGIIITEIGYQSRYFSFKLNVKGFDDVKPAFTRLPCDYPVNVSVIIEPYAYRCVGVNIGVRSGV